MLKQFLTDRSGNYALATIGAMVPLMGALALGVDYTEMSRQKQATINATDAAAVATARRLVEGAPETELNAYARTFFDANSRVAADLTKLTLTLPANNSGGGTLKLTTDLKYGPIFLGAFEALTGREQTKPDFSVTTEVQLKNTMEIALVLDNSSSMEELGTGSGKKRLDLLKTASKQLVDTLAAQGQMIKQLNKPVQVSVVPFSGFVNVGANNKSASWMDTTGVSSVHHENLNWKSMEERGAAAWQVQQVGTAWYARGASWSTYGLKDRPLTRFSLYENMKYSNGAAATAWLGCVEARPYPYNVTDDAPTTSNPDTMFVPNFAPDEFDKSSDGKRYAPNNWWNDKSASSDYKVRQAWVSKYFDRISSPLGFMDEGLGPNYGCYTTPITPLTDVTNATGLAKVKKAIDDLTMGRGTNVPEATAWGWRTVSSQAPFTEGRPETEKGNDKILFVLTDGENSYYPPEPNGVTDLATNRSTYGAYAYTGTLYQGGTTRMFRGTNSSFNKSDYTKPNYAKAMGQHFDTLCANAKAAGMMIITVSLDLSTTVAEEKAQIERLKACSSDSRWKKDSNGAPLKLYWNTTGANLNGTFQDIADELSNLRIVG